MLEDALKTEIQSAYTRLLDEKGYRPRGCQKTMIAEIARTLGAGEGEPNICVVEAGTGTGKTIAYALAALPVARQQKKKIVIATATIALQEQIIYQDLPDICVHADMEVSYALAKGRRRYLCLARLDQSLQNADTANQTMSMFAGMDEGMDGEIDEQLFQRMLDALGEGEWDGERDSWPEEVQQTAWNRVSTDHAQCTGRQCSHYDNCYFYRARESIHRVDCIVTNQDLVLSDLMMGGGAVLPDPEDTIYIFDEGHHLPDKAGNHFSHVLSIYGTRNWLLQIPTSLKLAAADMPELDPTVTRKAEALIDTLIQRMDEAAQHLQGLQEEADPQDEGWRYRFPLGRVDVETAKLSGGLAQVFSRAVALMEGVVPQLEQVLEDTPAAERELAEQWLSMMTSIESRLVAAVSLWSNFAIEVLDPPYARWVRFTTAGQVEGMEIQLSSHPVSIAEELDERLWSRCAGAVVTSATLSVGRDFSQFQDKSGIHPGNRFISLQSPFRFQEQAVLHIPQMDTEPGDADAHTAEITSLIPQLLKGDGGSLVLFTSWRQMLRVLDDLDDDFRERVIAQGELSKIEMLNRHKSRIDDGEPSCLFGLASFAEGVDLPGDYCRHVVIAKLPFAVPDDPVDATLSEWVEDRGGNAFYEVMLPGATLRVVQAAGRLLRTESDSGQVTILDRRLVTKRYGSVILNALPPFRRDIR